MGEERLRRSRRGQLPLSRRLRGGSAWPKPLGNGAGSGADFDGDWYYDPDGDCLTILTTNESYLAKRIDTWFTVYYGRETKNAIGFLIKGLKEIVRRARQAPGWRRYTNRGYLPADKLVTLGMFYSDSADKSDQVFEAYEELENTAREWNRTVKLPDLVLQDD